MERRRARVARAPRWGRSTTIVYVTGPSATRARSIRTGSPEPDRPRSGRAALDLEGAHHSMRFIHIADVHLDTPFARHTPELRSRLRDASRESFRRAVSLGIAQSVDAFVIAGDLFDGETLELSTERFIREEFARLSAAGIQVVYATGNHDPGNSSVRDDRIEWPENVTVVGGPDPGDDRHRAGGRGPGRPG